MAAITKKREARKSLRQPAWITLEGGFAARQCMVQDISTSGAKITVDDPNILPAHCGWRSRAMLEPGETAKWSGAAASRSASSSSGSIDRSDAIKGGMRNIPVAIIVALLPAPIALAAVRQSEGGQSRTQASCSR